LHNRNCHLRVPCQRCWLHRQRGWQRVDLLGLHQQRHDHHLHSNRPGWQQGHVQRDRHDHRSSAGCHLPGSSDRGVLLASANHRAHRQRHLHGRRTYAGRHLLVDRCFGLQHQQRRCHHADRCWQQRLDPHLHRNLCLDRPQRHLLELVHRRGHHPAVHHLRHLRRFGQLRRPGC